MEKAKQAVSSFISGDGHHKTTVDEGVNKAVTEEQVRPHRHEDVTTAVDREVHQDHHHTTIQPIKDQETLPEKHHHNVVPVTHKTFEHGNERETKDILDREASRFKDTSTTHETTHSSTVAPTVTGERVHHHVHEHIQPVIQKDTIQPHVVHTTVPIHETHHAKPVHHETTVLPAKTVDEFTKERGTIDGPGHKRFEEFDGCPKKFNNEFQTSEHAGVAGLHGEKQNGSGKTTAGAAGAVAAGGAAAVAAHKHHEHSKNDTADKGAHGHGVGQGGLGGQRVGQYDQHNTGKTGAAAGAAGAAAAAHKSHTGSGQNTIIHGANTQGTPDSVAAAKAADARSSERDVRDKATHDHTVGGNNTTTSTTEGIRHGTHTTPVTHSGNHDDNYTTSKGSTFNPTAALNQTEPRFGSSATGTGHVGTKGDHAGMTDASGKKVSLVDKLNPFKDADGDGHKGIMS
ncbi:hypothetical protein CCHL11_02185 [Colletotrichum chlorophyti]|uniref:Allergen n=1 Tax=Colletotrichum chlorophyti TaxID=708187 RepID=A0A1Q8S6L0_9PEZI|nr:hypothetical protein CCHL11_02185 [Colletotrichum chlorophyti]